MEEQKADLELSQIRQTTMTEGEVGEVPVGYFVQNDVLMRKWRDPRSPASEVWSVVRQVVLPPSYRPEVLRLAHEAPVAGHVGVRKTQARIMAHFYWPQLHIDMLWSSVERVMCARWWVNPSLL